MGVVGAPTMDDKVEQFVETQLVELDVEAVNLYHLRGIALCLQRIADSLDSLAYNHGG